MKNNFKKVLTVALGVAVAFAVFMSIEYCSYATETTETVASNNILHVHSGSSSGGGCYTHLVSEPYSYAISYNTTSGGSWNCYNCGKSVDGNCTMYHYADGQNSWVGTCPHCGRSSTGGSTCAPPRYNSGTKTYYTLNCGLDVTSVVGNISMDKIVDTSYRLKISSVSIDSQFIVTGYAWNTGDTADEIVVSGNNSYSCNVSYTDRGRVGSVSLTYNVTDYDLVPPIINGYTLFTSDRTNLDVVIKLDISDNFSGVYGYSVNGGDYVQSTEFLAQENGTYYFKAKDNVGNETDVTSVTIDIIDKANPVIDNVELSW